MAPMPPSPAHPLRCLARLGLSLVISSAACLTSSLAWAQGHRHEHGAHVHGQAHLQIAIDGKQVKITLESPLDNLQGFEHAPRNPREKQAAEAMAAQLRQAESLLVLTPAAQCKANPVDLLAPAAHAGADKHGDLEAEFSFDCATPPQDLEVRLFAAFPRLKQLDVQMVTPAGQSARQLTPDHKRISW